MSPAAASPRGENSRNAGGADANEADRRDVRLVRLPAERLPAERLPAEGVAAERSPLRGCRRSPGLAAEGGPWDARKTPSKCLEVDRLHQVIVEAG